MPGLDRAAHVVVRALEAAMMVLLAALVLLGIAGLVLQIGGALHPPFLVGEDLTKVLGDVLAVFVLIELLTTAAAYLRGADILRRLFETMFVAIVRKLLTLELTSAPLEKAGAVALLLVATAATWWLIARARPLHE
jgi:uncharacterized membrane protein (DUF373 family)